MAVEVIGDCEIDISRHTPAVIMAVGPLTRGKRGCICGRSSNRRAYYLSDFRTRSSRTAYYLTAGNESRRPYAVLCREIRSRGGAWIVAVTSNSVLKIDDAPASQRHSSSRRFPRLERKAMLP